MTRPRRSWTRASGPRRPRRTKKSLGPRFAPNRTASRRTRRRRWGTRSRWKPRFVVSVLVPLRPFAPTPSSPPPPPPRRRRRNSDPPRRRCTTPVIKRRWTPPWALWTRTTPPPPWRRRRARRARSDPARSTTDTSEASTRFPPSRSAARRSTRLSAPRDLCREVASGPCLRGDARRRRRRRVPRSIKSRATIRTDTR